MAAAAVDVGYLAASYDVPETTLHSLLSEPTVQLFQSLIPHLEAKARQYDELKSDKLRSDVELEAAVRNAETRARAVSTAAEKARKETEELRQKLATEETARQQLESDLQNVRTSTADSSSEIQTLQSRIKALEASNRDAIALTESKSTANDRLNAELLAQQRKISDLRAQISQLEEANQTLRDDASKAKSSEQNARHEITLLNKNLEYYQAEAKTLADNGTKLRKEKNAQVAELQRSNADAQQTIESLRRTEEVQRKRLADLEQTAESALTRVQNLQDELAQKEEFHREELENTRRLAKLHQESAETVKSRLQEVQVQLQQVEDAAAQEIGQLQAEFESEREKLRGAEIKIEELESLVESFNTQTAMQRSTAQAPSTPRRSFNGPFDTPGRAGSPAASTPGGSRRGLTMSQLYNENSDLRNQLHQFRQRDKDRAAVMKEMVDELESRQPELEELKQENDRLQTSFDEISDLLEQANGEREAARKEARKAIGDYQGAAREIELQRQQLRDLGAQVTLFVVQRTAQEQGLEALTPQQQQLLQEAANNKAPDSEIADDETPTGRIIAKHLVIFNSVEGLQRQNAELLRTIREVANSHEGAEAREKANQLEKDRKELAQVREELAQLEEELRSLKLRSQSFQKERDMYRRIVTSRGQLPPGSDGASLDLATPPPRDTTPSVAQTPHTRELASYDKLIKDLQAHSDMLKEESATDRASWKQQVDRLAKENNQLQGEKMRLNNQQILAQERFQLQQQRLDLLISEKNEVQKRLDAVQDAAVKQDIRTQQTAEELVEAKSQIDSLVRENTNLKASQDFWKSIETRLTQENKTLAEERSRISKVIQDIQTMRNEHEATEADNRRRLQTRVDSLEAELQIATRKLDDEIEDHKKSNLRREYEQGENRKRVDDLTRAYNDARTELAAVKTARDQLQQRVSELQAELRDAEERIQNLQPRATQQLNGSDADDASTREEELVAQISSLQLKLDRSQEEVQTANGHIEAYKSIAQQAEEDLQSHMDAADAAQQEYERVQAENESTISDLRKRVDEISSELATTNTELSELRSDREKERLLLTQEKEMLESEIANIKEEMNDYKEAADTEKQNVRVQANIANRAQQDYENELAKHGETMKTLRSIRDEYNQLKTEIVQYKSSEEAARTSLAQGEEHWAATRERYEREITEARTKYNDLSEHNKTLLQQFDDYQEQITSLKNNRLSVAAGEADAGTDNGSNGLQQIVAYLRREKEILEMSHKAKEHENNRLQLQLTHVQNELEHTTEKLIAEQTRANLKDSASTFESLQQSIEQLNVYRESTTTLRNDLRRIEAQLAAKNKEVEDLQSQIEPLHARVQEAEGELELSAGHIKNLEQDRDRWQKRHQDVLHKYDRIDPKELEDLKQQIEDLQTERDQALEQLKGVDERVEVEKSKLKEELETGFQSRREAMTAQFKGKVASMKQVANEKDASIQSLTQEREQLRQQLDTVQQELEAVSRARDEAVATANTKADVNMDEEGQVDEGSGISKEEKEALEARVQAAENKANEEASKAAAYHAQLQGQQETIQQLENQVEELQQRIASLDAQLLEAQKQIQQAQARIQQLESQSAPGESTAPVESAAPAQTSDEIEKLKEEIAARQKEIDDLRTQAEMAASLASQTQEDDSKPVDEQVAALRQQLEKTIQDKDSEMADLQARTNQKLERMKAKANELVRNANNEKAKLIEETKAEYAAELERVKKEHTGAPASQGEEEKPIKSEGVPGPDASEREIQDWLSSNTVAMNIMRRNITRRMEQVRKEAKEEAAAQNQQADAAPAPTADEQEKAIAQKIEEATAAIKAEQDQIVQQKVDEAKKEVEGRAQSQAEKKFAARDSLQKNKMARIQAQIDVVKKAADETPQEPVGEVWKVAQTAKPAPAQPATPAKAPAPAPVQTEPTKQANATPNQVTQQTNAPPAQSGQQQASAVPNQASQSQPRPESRIGLPQPGTAIPQSNGIRSNPFSGPPSFGGVPNMGNSFQQPGQAGQGFGTFAGLPQPGFSGNPNQMAQFSQNNSRPNSPFGQQQPTQQQGPPANNVGTGPGALRSIVNQQGNVSSIPRGGGIPRPGGRGGPANVGGPGQSQIARGGAGRGRGGGRGQPGPNSPGALNPGAQNFQPGTGRGQKRGHDDDGGDGGRGGKRPRGGNRGGAGAGAGGE